MGLHSTKTIIAAAAPKFNYIGQIYVDTVNGSDSNNGRSIGNAKQTLAAAKAALGATVRGEIIIVGGPDAGVNTCFVDAPIVLYDGQTIRSYGHTPAGESGVIVAASDSFVGDAVIMSYTWLTGGTWFTGAIDNITVDARNKAAYGIAISQFGEEALLRRLFVKGATDTNIYCAGTHAVGQIEDCSVWWMTGSSTKYGIVFGLHPTNPTRASADGAGGVVRMFGISGDNGPVGSPGTALGHIHISGSHTMLIDGLKSEQWNPVVVIDGAARVFLNGDAIKTTPQAGDLINIAGGVSPTITLVGMRANQYANIINDTVHGTTLPCPAAGTRIGFVEWSYDAGGVAHIKNNAGVTISSPGTGITLGLVGEKLLGVAAGLMTNRARSTRYLIPNGGSAGSTTLANNQQRYSPLWVPGNLAVVITAIGLEIVVVGNAGSLVRLGIYAGDGNGLPTGAPLLDAGTIAADTTGYKEITGLSLALDPGLYWVTAAAQSAATTAPQIRNTTGLLPGVIIFAGGGVNASGYIDSASVSGALPNASATSNGAGPLVHLKVQ